MRRLSASVFAALGLFALHAAAEDAPAPPVVPTDLSPKIELLKPGVKLTLLAEHPALVTPTGIDVDEKGNIWLISCHTHFRPKGYAGPAHDEILVFDRNGQNRRVFYNKTDATMHLLLGHAGWVYLTERKRVLRVKDTDGDGVGDVEETLATLDSLDDYPHNGLSGLAWHPNGDLLFSLGENHGKDWVLTARDSASLTGRGEGGIFRCKADGSGMHRIARGFWNPFGLLVRPDQEIFAVDNDPGSRPPCRLLSIIEGADYGFQYVYGSAPVHPFVAWNGELRGTLPMIHPSCEAPCALVELGGGVLVPSWANHCINYYPLVRKGAGYTSEEIPLLRGSDNFRPVCIAPGPDGAFYLTDWVYSSYALHGRGRLWKLEIDKTKAPWIKDKPEPMNDAAKLAKALREGKDHLGIEQLFAHARGSDAYLSDAALAALARGAASWTPDYVRNLPMPDRVWALMALRRANLNDDRWVRLLIHDEDPEIRFECLRWIADAVMKNFTADVDAMLTRSDLDYHLFEAALAAGNTLHGNPEAGVTDPAKLLECLTNTTMPLKLKGYALRLMPPTHPKLKMEVLQDLLQKNDPALSREVIRTLAQRNGEDTLALLTNIATDESREAESRADAIVGLAASSTPAMQSLLIKLAASHQAPVRHEALRALRFSSLDAKAQETLGSIAKQYPDSAGLVQATLDPASINTGRPKLDDTDAWMKRLTALPGQADAAAGRRVFSHPRMAQCITCHRHSGRGNVVGPDLTLIAQQGGLKSTLVSILEPNRDVAPQYYPTLLKLTKGGEFIGILLRSSSTEVYRDITGQERTFQKSEIADHTDLKTSLMPTGLVAAFTDEELRDLLAFVREGEK